jgi:hypothetical protein
VSSFSGGRSLRVAESSTFVRVLLPVRPFKELKLIRHKKKTENNFHCQRQGEQRANVEQEQRDVAAKRHEHVTSTVT